ncbi:ABC-type transport auxiliary lipoprotein family protein [Desulfatitalea alkaliphila]|uniref:ABC-type transport auxiliary lipoprotein family protein n=1 Tax=Desulfatitalea alkaliphila TaxID=2929485 RepID=A0AA41R505_9BACT|nr:ABC-type transport auxiliary lipoprotein family protein [Desulfatitalea alkaliphila]MCJ8501967.1 ABC-type transport auxiliary lipoprotein family protein [Desulfatitalea alkaliphila]
MTSATHDKTGHRFYRLLLMALPALLLIGCGGRSDPARPMYYYTLDYPPPITQAATPLPYALRIERFSAAPPFDTQRIIYADKDLHRNAYASSRWVAPPGDMLAYLLARDLQRANALQAVIAPDDVMTPTHVVKGWVEEFLEEGTTAPAQAAIRVNITLLDADQSDPVARVLHQGTYHARAPLAERNPAALSRAMSLAASQVMIQIRDDVLGVLVER